MTQASRETLLKRIETGLNRLALAARDLQDARPNGADTVSRESHEAIVTAHNLLRERAEAAITGIDRLLNDERKG